MDSWTPKQLKCMQLGGNHSLGEFLSSYDLMSEPMDVRYETKASEYYRKKLKAFCNDEEFNEEKPDYEEGRKPIEYKIRSAEEIKEITGSTAPKSAGDVWDYTKSVAVKGVSYAGQGVKNVGDKIKESGIGDKISSGAKTVGSKTVEYGGIAYNKTKQGITSIVTNEKVQDYSKKTIEGAKGVGKSVWGFMSSTFNKITNKPEAAQNNGENYDYSDHHAASNEEVKAPDYSAGT